MTCCFDSIMNSNHCQTLEGINRGSLVIHILTMQIQICGDLFHLQRNLLSEKQARMGQIKSLGISPSVKAAAS